MQQHVSVFSELLGRSDRARALLRTSRAINRDA